MFVLIIVFLERINVLPDSDLLLVITLMIPIYLLSSLYSVIIDIIFYRYIELADLSDDQFVLRISGKTYLLQKSDIEIIEFCVNENRRVSPFKSHRVIFTHKEKNVCFTSREPKDDGDVSDIFELLSSFNEEVNQAKIEKGSWIHSEGGYRVSKNEFYKL